MSGAKVTAGLLPLLGVEPLSGRLFDPGEEEEQVRVALVSEGFARRRYGGVEAAVGVSLRVQGRPYTVVGVLPRVASYPSGAELWIPLDQGDFRARLGFGVVARLGDGVSLAAAREEVQAIGARLVELDPDRNADAGLNADLLQRNLLGSLGTTLGTLSAAVLFLFLIAAANATCLVFARAGRREEEVALRVALGASRRSLVTMVAAEQLLLGLGGAALGALLARSMLPPLIAVSGAQLFTFAPPEVDLRVLAFASLAGLLTVLVCGLAPTVRLLASAGGVAGTGGRRATRSRRFLTSLVVADVAITAVLLIGSLLMVSSVRRLAVRATGISHAEATTVGVSAPRGHAEEHARRVDFFRRVQEEVAGLPGIDAVGATTFLPMTQPEYYWGFSVEGQRPADPNATELELFRTVSSGYFEALGIPLVRGRLFRDGDGAEGRPQTVVVSAAFARRYWPGEEAVGKRLKSGRYDADSEWVEVAGVVGDVRERGLAQPIEPALYFSYRQRDRRYHSRMHLVLKAAPGAAVDFDAVRARIGGVAPETVIFAVEPIGAVIDRSLERPRFAMLLLGVFAALAVVQAAAGLYGVFSYQVHDRIHELGVRMAVGADAARLRRMVVLSALRLAAVGLAVGAAAGAALTRLAATMFVGVDAWEPSVYGTVAAVVVAVVLLSTWLPARRAAALDPVVALGR